LQFVHFPCICRSRRDGQQVQGDHVGSLPLSRARPL